MSVRIFPQCIMCETTLTDPQIKKKYRRCPRCRKLAEECESC